MITLSLVAVIYIGLVALVQTDMKKLVAYLSIAHMGFVTLGFFMFNEISIATLLGSLFLVWADVLARILVKNAELPIGIFTALVGMEVNVDSLVVVLNEKLLDVLGDDITQEDAKYDYGYI